MPFCPRRLLLTPAFLALAALGLAGPAALGQAPAPSGLPAGHPDISALLKAAPATQQGAGVLTIRAAQGTAGGSAVAGDKVAVEIYAMGQLVREAEGILDEAGRLVVKDVPVALPCQAIVKVTHAGVEYAATGPVLDAEHAAQAMSVSVYDTTETAPAWGIQMRHVIVHRAEGLLQVTDMLYLSNPGDRTWIGAAKDGKRITLDLPLPPTVRNVQVSENLRDAGTQFTGGRIVSAIPLTPGQVGMQVAYSLPAGAGETAWDVPAPAPVSQMMLFVPDDGTGVTVDGLGAGGKTGVGQEAARCYRGANLPAGAVVKIALHGSPADAGASPKADSAHTGRLLAISCLALVVLGALAIAVFLRPGGAAAKAPANAAASPKAKRRAKGR